MAALVLSGTGARDAACPGRARRRLTMVGAVVLGPSWPGRWPGARAGLPALFGRMTGRLACATPMRNPRRTAGTASALMVGVAVVTLFTVFAASISRTIDDTIDGQFAATDLV